MNNIGIYNQRMEAGMVDKCFFLEKIDFNLLVDFGCANGALIKAIADDKKIYVGFDNSQEMIDIAEHNLQNHNSGNIKFTTNWDDIDSLLTKTIGNKILVLSSVIHEVYSYSTKSEVELFWYRVFNSGFTHIVVRDMLPYSDIQTSRRLPDDYYRDVALQVAKSKFGHKQSLDYEKVWGNWLETNDFHITHFLLKYKYTDNWEREVRENYFSFVLG